MLKIIFVNMKRSNTPVLRVAGSKLLLQLALLAYTQSVTCLVMQPHVVLLFRSDHGWTLSVCFVMVSHEDHFLLRAAGWPSVILSGP